MLLAKRYGFDNEAALLNYLEAYRKLTAVAAKAEGTTRSEVCRGALVALVQRNGGEKP